MKKPGFALLEVMGAAMLLGIFFATTYKIILSRGERANFNKEALIKISDLKNSLQKNLFSNDTNNQEQEAGQIVNQPLSEKSALHKFAPLCQLKQIKDSINFREQEQEFIFYGVCVEREKYLKSKQNQDEEQNDAQSKKS